jgi:hypothetical protein
MQGYDKCSRAYSYYILRILNMNKIIQLVNTTYYQIISKSIFTIIGQI